MSAELPAYWGQVRKLKLWLRNAATSKQESPSLQLKVLVPGCLFKVPERRCCEGQSLEKTFRCKLMA